MEQWKDYKYGYQVSNKGRVKREGYGVVSAPPNQSGYPRRVFERKGVTQGFLVHRAVAELFIENPDDKPQVNHINGDKTDNRVENLEWCTSKENMAHAHKTGIMKNRKPHSTKKKLTADDVLLVKTYPNLPAKFFASEFGCSRVTINFIRNGKIWKHV